MSEVALATAPLTAPPVIRALLAKLAIPYAEVADLPGLNPAQKVQAVLLEDAVGALMVLFPQSQLLDLNRLAELTGRRLTAVSPDRVERMLGKHDLSLLPGLPPLTSSPCLYEGSLLDEPSLLVHSGEAGLLLEIATDAFRTLLTKASAGHFGEPLSNIRPNLDRPNDDREEITQAMQAFTARRIQQRLEATIEIPPLADTAQKIIKLRVDPNATIDDITGVVETDPALAAQVVSWAASPNSPVAASRRCHRIASNACWASMNSACYRACRRSPVRRACTKAAYSTSRACWCIRAKPGCYWKYRPTRSRRC